MARGRGGWSLLSAVGLVAALAAAAPGASAQQAVQEFSFKASDGVSLHGTVSGEAPLVPRPLIVEYSLYGLGPGGPPAGPGFNYVQVHARGTGRSGGAWEIMGPREQLDINSIVVGGGDGARLQFPILPGSDLCAALGAPPCPQGQP